MNEDCTLPTSLLNGKSLEHPCPYHFPPRRRAPPNPILPPINLLFLQAVISTLPSTKYIPDGLKAHVKHFSSTAYLQMALHGYSLRHSLVAASQLLRRHRRRMQSCEGAAHAAVMPGKVGTDF